MVRKLNRRFSIKDRKSYCFYKKIVMRVVSACLCSSLLVPAMASSQSITDWVGENCESCAALMVEKTGVYILDRGEEALMGRAWLTQHASRSIDIQYFIWSTDNIGILAAEMLLAAADRGVTIRVLVDDFLIDADEKTLIFLADHPNVKIRIYNPNVSVGTSLLGRLFNSATDFRSVNQRMHDKTAIFDGVAGITGGRNMADEYFDFDPDYNFRDRDALLLGAAVQEMHSNFEDFWKSPLSVPVEQLLEDLDEELSAGDTQRHYDELHAYARDPENFGPAVRNAIEIMPTHFPKLLQRMTWSDARFISDDPGKNDGESGLAGGGASTRELINAWRDARPDIRRQFIDWLRLTDPGCLR